MKFLLNMNLPRTLGKKLDSHGHCCRHVADIGMAKATDDAIVQEAGQKKETILTHDLDYGHILAFSGFSEPPVVIFRLRNTQPDYLLTQFLTHWPEIVKPLTQGAIVVLEDSALRIRYLPITSEKHL